MQRLIFLSFGFLLLSFTVKSQTYNWSHVFGDNAQDRIDAVAFDSRQNSFVTGKYSGSVDIEPGVGTTILANQGNTFFVASYTRDGALRFHFIVGNYHSLTGIVPIDMTSDSEDNIYVVGNFYGYIDFDPDPVDEAYLNSNQLISDYAMDVFVAKYTSTGDYLWAFKFGSYGHERVSKIVLDTNDNFYLVGENNSTTDFDPGPFIDEWGAGAREAFVANYTSDGNYLWARSFSPFSGNLGLDLCIDGAGDVYVAGLFDNTGDFDPGSSTDYHTSLGARDFFISKYSANGAYQFTKTFGGIGDEQWINIYKLDNNDILIAGTFEDTVDIDFGPGTTIVTALPWVFPVIEDANIFIARYTSSLDLEWGVQLGTENNIIGLAGITEDLQGQLYAYGRFAYTVDFDPGPATVLVSSTDGSYILQLSDSGIYRGVTTMKSGTLIRIDDVDINPCGGLIAGGFFKDDITFSGGPTSLEIASDWEGWMARYDQPNFVGIDPIINSVSASADTICEGDTLTVTVDGQLNSAIEWLWYEGSCGSNQVGQGNSIQIMPDSSASYFVSGESGCVNLFCQSVQVQVKTCGIIQDVPRKGRFVNYFQVLPNPNSGEFRLMLNLNQRSNYEIRITNCLGQLIYSEKLRSMKGSNEKQLDLSEYSSGVYYLQIASDIEVVTGKLIIEK